MNKDQLRVSEWMTRFGQEVKAKPEMPSLEVRKLRAKLILEEALELTQALGFDIGKTRTDFSDEERPDFFDQLIIEELEFREFYEPNLVELADGLADLDVVRLGTAAACGIDLEPVMDEVLRSNDSKMWTSEEIEAVFETSDFRSKYTWSRVGNMLYGRNFIVRDKDGKIIKSPSYSPANLEPILKEQQIT